MTPKQNTTKKKEKRVKAWGVIWSTKAWIGRDKNKIVRDEFHDNHKNGPYDKPMVFTKKADADLYASQLAEGDTVVRPVTITYSLPITPKKYK